MKKLEVYRQLLLHSVELEMPSIDILLRCVVLHTHSIALKADVSIEDVLERPVVLGPLTRSHVAEILASLWPAGTQRGDRDFWAGEYRLKTPYESFESLPSDVSAQALAAFEAIASHPMVARLIPD